MDKCITCGAPVNPAPDGDPKSDLNSRHMELKKRDERIHALKTALAEILATEMDGTCCGCGQDDGVDKMHEIARAALLLRPLKRP